MTDKALAEVNIDDFLTKLNSHIYKVVRGKYQKVAELEKVKDNSKEQGRAFVKA